MTGLAVFASDALGSVAYATEAILLILGLARGGGAPPLHGDLGCHRRADLVVSAYGPPIRAYPWGGGSAIVTRENLGRARRG